MDEQLIELQGSGCASCGRTTRVLHMHGFYPNARWLCTACWRWLNDDEEDDADAA